jgi:glycosyltransferase involved in cell wall biosynthesis
MYNEDFVAERIIEASCKIDYPREKFEIQVLDDSTDHSAEIAKAAVEKWAAKGLPIHYLHRNNREGYKAGALQEGLKTATGEFIAIFDADFVPPVDILYNVVDYFTDDKVGMVQVRWDHLNRDASLLTKGQAIFLDGHFVIEHTARNRSGRFMHFNGTAGVWRRTTIGGRTSAGDHRLQTAGSPLDQGFDADGLQTVAAHSEIQTPAPRREDRGILPPDQYDRLSADGPADAHDVPRVHLL